MPYGRAVQRRAHPGRFADRVDGAVEVVGDRRHPAAEQESVPVAVHGHFVSRRDDLPRKRRPLHDLLTDQEEGRCRVPARELVEHRRRALRVRAVVERDRNDRTVDAELEIEPAREPRHVSGERRRDPDHVTSASTSDAADGSAVRASPGAWRVASAPRSARSRSLSLSTTSAIP